MKLAHSKVLVVGENPDAPGSLAAYLKVFAFEPVSVASEPEALAWLERGKAPSLMIVDLDARGQHGLDLIARLWVEPELRSIPVAIAATELPFDLPRYVEIIQKPILLPQLLLVVRKHSRPKPSYCRIPALSRSGSRYATAVR